MGLDDTFTPPLFYFNIPQGTHFHLEFPPFVEAETGEPFDFTDDPEGDWHGRLEIRTQSGTLVAAFADTGEDGVISFNADGVVALDMLAADTLLLPATASGDSAVLVCDLELTDPFDSEPWRWAVGRGRITREVTTG